jgi:hypothetical protein
MVAAECFTKFKEWKVAKPPANNGNGQGNNGNGNKGARRQERLEQAITPRGDGGATANAIDEEAAFNAGFESVRKRGT